MSTINLKQIVHDIKEAYVKAISLGGGARNVVLAREVLPTPKQVSADETFTVSMVIEM